jgi:cobalt-zinc-cadmium efflux system outer membrane protein
VQAGQDRKPEVGIFAGYMRMDSGFPQSGFNAAGALDPIHATFNNVAAGVRLTVPVFNRGQGAVAAARAQQAGAAYELDARRLAARSDVAIARARADAAAKAIAIYAGDARTLARKNLDVVRETYALGRATLFDVLNEQRRYLEFENAYTDALAEAFAAHTALQRATGEIK